MALMLPTAGAQESPGVPSEAPGQAADDGDSPAQEDGTAVAEANTRDPAESEGSADPGASPGPSAESPETGKPAGAGASERSLVGAAKGPQADETATTPDSQEPEPEPPSVPTPAEFLELIAEAITLEIEVRENEDETLGADDIASLSGYRLLRRQRIDEDKLDLEQRVFQMPRKVLVFPDPAEVKRKLSVKGIIVLEALNRVYLETRTTNRLKNYIKSNSRFLRVGDWLVRDQAVIIRDNIIQKEAAFKTLAEQAQNILRGKVSPEEIEEMLQTLDKLAPDGLGDEADITRLVLQDDSMRRNVVQEVSRFLRSPREAVIPSLTTDDLMRPLPGMRIGLLVASGLDDVVNELGKIQFDIDAVNERLMDKGVDSLDLTERKTTVKQKQALVSRQVELKTTWKTTPPEAEALAALVDAQDQTLRRSLYELGFRGALYIGLYEDLRAEQASMQNHPFAAWKYVDDQSNMIELLRDARPEPPPLEGLAPPTDPSQWAAQAKLIQQLQKQRPDLFRKPPKVVAGGKKKGKGKKKPR